MIYVKMLQRLSTLLNEKSVDENMSMFKVSKNKSL